MRLYRHYKHKFYKFLSEATHSETGETFVVYECGYANPKGQTWIRPREMFFGAVKIGGQARPRFAPHTWAIDHFEQVSAPLRTEVADFLKRNFVDWDPDNFQRRFVSHAPLFLQIARLDEKIVGLKLGYPLSSECFYSWFGAVAPEYRGLGLGAALMRDQHIWFRAKNFLHVETKTLNTNQAMIRLNLNHDFLVEALEPTPRGLKLVLRKSLTTERTPV